MSQPWLDQFESHLNALDEVVAASDRSLVDVLHQAQIAFAVLAEDPVVDGYLVRGEVIESLSGQPVDDDQPVRDSIEATGALYAESAGTHTFGSRTPLADQLNLCCLFTATSLKVPVPACRDGAQTLTDFIATRVSRGLLSDFEGRFHQQQSLTTVATKLACAETLHAAAEVVAHDAAACLADCRISVLHRSLDSWKLLAATGVSRPNQNAQMANQLCKFVDVFSTEEANVWLDVASLPDEAMRESLRQSNVEKIRLCTDPVQTDVAVVVESFGSVQLTDAQLQQFNAATLPVLGSLASKERSRLSVFWSRRIWRNAAILAAIALFLAFWPVDFEVEVAGQIQPETYRRVFAPENGTIDRVAFTNEAVVAEDDVLLLMSSSTLSLEQQRVLGEIQTVSAQLTAARTKRVRGTDPNASMDEKIFEQKLKSLNEDKLLINRQLEDLEITAPFGGKVYLRNPDRELMARPVQRGQLLLQIVATNSKWNLEVEIPEKVRCYVLSHRDQTNQPLEVRYMVRSAPDQNWETSLDSIDSAVQIVGAELFCRGTGAISDPPDAHQRPGTAVTARIHCGRRSIGFVWFREIRELTRRLSFAWL